MTTIEPVPVVAPQRQSRGFADGLRDALPKIVLAPSFAVILVFVYGFILWTVYLSFTTSRILPVYKWGGFDAYFRLWGQPNWYVAMQNLAIFGILYIGICITIGLFLAQTETSSSGPGVMRLVAGKLLLQPAVTAVLAFYVFAMPPVWAWTAVLMSALPIGTGPFMLAQMYGRDARVTSRAILVSTVASVLTVSLLVAWISAHPIS